MATGIIYCIFNKVNGKAYVGQTWGCRKRPEWTNEQKLENRWRQHCRRTHCCVLLRNAIRKYGREAFTLAILTSGLTTQEDMTACEVYWCGYLHTMNRENGYNLRVPGSRGRHSEETRLRMGEVQRNRYANMTLLQKAAFAESVRQGQLERLKDPAAREINRQAMLNLYKNPVAIEKNRQGQLKRFRDPEQREKRSRSAKKQFQDPVQIEKSRQGQLKRWQDPVQHEIASKSHLSGRIFVCVETGEKFENQCVAAAQLGIHQGSLSKVLLGERLHAEGYHFRYVEETVNV